MSKINKLIQKAIKSPQNLTFNELCKLHEHFEMERRKNPGGHIIYKRKTDPKFTLTIQNDNGKAKPYQVRQLINKVKEHNLYDFKEKD